MKHQTPIGAEELRLLLALAHAVPGMTALCPGSWSKRRSDPSGPVARA